MSDPRVCIIGAGSLSSRRIYPYIGLAGGRLVGVCDVVKSSAERNAGRFGGAAYADWEAMLEREKPDGVIVCIGPEEHAVVATAVLRKGYPVYTEKPPAATAEQALAVARVAHETGLLCTTAFKKRYATAYARAREWLDGFADGDKMSMSIDYCSGQYDNKSARSSFLLDFAVHCIDLTQYLMGDVARVFAFTKEQHAYAVSLQFRNGATGTLNLNDGRSFTVPTEEVELTARGGNWMTIHNSSSWKIVKEGQGAEWREPPTFTSGGDSGNDTGHLAEIVDFLKAIEERRTTRSNIYESYKTMVLYEAIRDAAATGQVVDVITVQVGS
jgi:predicted dehydrogenase